VSPVSKVNAGADLKETVRRAVADLGGFSQFVRPGDSVLIKPNFNTADPPPASTAPEFLAAVVDLVFESGASRVFVGESSMLSAKKRSTEATLAKAGVYELEERSRPAEIHVFDDHEWVEREIPRGRFLQRVSMPKILDEVDRIILLPCCKTHAIAGFTGALKIAVGFMKPSERIRLHLGRVPEKVAELNSVYRPDLVIMDARRCFIAGGPAHGEVRTPGLVLASRSRIDIDVEEVRIIQSYPGNALAGRDPEDLQQIKHARDMGIS